jgi:hypothetical protein
LIRLFSQVLHISNKRNPLKYNYNIHGHILEEAKTSKYLGINLIRTLSWNNHINTVVKKASNISASFSIGVTLVVSLKSLYTNPADRLCTAPSLFIAPSIVSHAPSQNIGKSNNSKNKGH